MNVLGISALDTDSTVAIVSNGRVVAAVAEERLSRIKMHAGFPHQALDTVLNIAGMKPNDIDIITYPFYDWHIEASLMSSGYLIDFFKNIFCFNWKSFSALREAMEKEIKDNR
ncbi:MAG: hypothetical protein NTZ95_03970, partial [Candidatus Omnitrophica bacterium]|nr:hypothetical protein [Candidatus Omnitrophota bacterium]